jgi:heat-inducible transcriptional repressor
LHQTKKQIILYSIISEYIKAPNPIGSEQLKIVLDIDLSSATIRNYFKKLSENGELEQIHTSSGRVPTNSALQNYWLNRLQTLYPIKFNSLTNMKKLSQKLGIFFTYRYATYNNLQRTINIDDEFLLLIFDDNQIAVEYNKKVEKFLQDFIGSGIDNINEILGNVGISSVSRKIDHHNIKNAKSSNSKEIMKLIVDDLTEEELGINMINAKVLDTVDDGVYFDGITPAGYMAIKDRVSINNREAKFFCLGKLTSDFNVFFTKG